MSPVSDSDRTPPSDRPDGGPTTGTPIARADDSTDPTPDPTAELRRLFAGTAPADPEPERVSRWQATLDQLPPPRPAAAGSAASPDTRTPDTCTDRPRTWAAHTSGTSPAPHARPAPHASPAPHARPAPHAALPRTALVAATLLAVALLGFPADSGRPATGTGSGTGPASPGAPLMLTRTQLPAAALTGYDLGPLADPAIRASCLARVGAHGEPLGGRPVILDGAPGILLALPTGRPGRIRLLVVDPGCGPGGAAVFADQTVGR